jgi:ankyrin repeat protein
MLKANPQLLTLTNSIGETVLHFLAIENDMEGVAWLHAHGFSLNTRNKFGDPMVFEVAGLGYKDLLLWLARNGVDLAVVDLKNRGILDYLEGNPNKLDPASEAHKRMEERKERCKETARFLVENIPSIPQRAG